MKNLILGYLALGVFLISTITPIVLYLSTFGTAFSSDHSRWAETGAFLSGIYSPMIAAMALIVLGFQLSLQTRMYKDQKIQSDVQMLRESAQDYLNSLRNSLDPKCDPNAPSAIEFLEAIDQMSMDDLRSDDGRATCALFAREHRTVLSSWSGISASLAELAYLDDPKSDLAISDLKLRLIRDFSEITCIQLDKGIFGVSLDETTPDLYTNFWRPEDA